MKRHHKYTHTSYTSLIVVVFLLAPTSTYIAHNTPHSTNHRTSSRGHTPHTKMNTSTGTITQHLRASAVVLRCSLLRHRKKKKGLICSGLPSRTHPMPTFSETGRALYPLTRGERRDRRSRPSWRNRRRSTLVPRRLHDRDTACYSGRLLRGLITVRSHAPDV